MQKCIKSQGQRLRICKAPPTGQGKWVSACETERIMIMHLDKMDKLYQRVRLVLLVSLVFFLISLFALVSRWDSAPVLIVSACAFRLIAVRLVRRPYSAAWTKAFTAEAAQKVMTDVRYTPREEAPAELLSALGFTPPLPLVPHTQLHHVLRGGLSGLPAFAAETAFVPQKRAAAGTGRVLSGTLVSAEDVLPAEESWVLLWHRPFDGLMPLSGFYSTWPYAGAPDGFPEGEIACFSSGGRTDSLEKAAAVLRPYCREPGAALAACQGRLSLFLPGSFYAQEPRLSLAPSEKELKGGTVAGLEILKKLCVRLR